MAAVAAVEVGFAAEAGSVAGALAWEWVQTEAQAWVWARTEAEVAVHDSAV